MNDGLLRESEAAIGPTIASHIAAHGYPGVSRGNTAAVTCGGILLPIS